MTTDHEVSSLIARQPRDAYRRSAYIPILLAGVVLVGFTFALMYHPLSKCHACDGRGGELYLKQIIRDGKMVIFDPCW